MCYPSRPLGGRRDEPSPSIPKESAWVRHDRLRDSVLEQRSGAPIPIAVTRRDSRRRYGCDFAGSHSLFLVRNCIPRIHREALPFGEFSGQLRFAAAAFKCDEQNAIAHFYDANCRTRNKSVAVAYVHRQRNGGGIRDCYLRHICTRSRRTRPRISVAPLRERRLNNRIRGPRFGGCPITTSATAPAADASV